MTDDTEIGQPEVDRNAPEPFSKRLKSALEELDEGQCFTLRTMNERTYITNIIGQVQKKHGIKFKTKVMVRRDEDPQGKLVLQITRVPAEIH